jgi:hypothetical protein
MLANFSVGAFLSLSVPKCTFPTPNSIEFGTGSVHFLFVALNASGLAVVLRTWREEPARLQHDELALGISIFSHFSASALATVSRPAVALRPSERC